MPTDSSRLAKARWVSPAVLVEVEYHFTKVGLDIANGPCLEALVAVMAEKVETLVELVDKSSYFYSDNFWAN